MKEIKNIIFDLGGVFINLDYGLTVKAFQQLGIQNFDELFTHKKQEHFFDDFEKGNLSAGNFRNEIRKHLSTTVSDEMIDGCWNKMLLDIPTEKISWLENISKKYRIFLLSNTNAIHQTALRQIVIQTFGKNVFEILFEKIYFSSIVHMRKPDAEIFELVIRENSLDKNETLFVDDLLQHIEGAKKCGLQTFWLQPGMKIEKDLF